MSRRVRKRGDAGGALPWFWVLLGMGAVRHKPEGNFNGALCGAQGGAFGGARRRALGLPRGKVGAWAVPHGPVAVDPFVT